MSVALASKNLCLRRNLSPTTARNLAFRRYASAAYASNKSLRSKPQNSTQDADSLTPEQQADQLMQAQIANRRYATYDMWSQPTEALGTRSLYSFL